MFHSILNFVFRFVMSLMLWIITVTLALAMVRVPFDWRENPAAVPLAAGFLGGVLFFFLISRFLVLYVFGHELTHFLMAKLFRRRTGRFRLRAASGSVAVERPNIWITLAPYFLPLYSIIWIGLYGVVDFFWKASPSWFPELFAAGVGITYAFHVRLTLYALARQQTDLERHGKMLSLSFICLCNVALLFVGILTATGEWGEGIHNVRRVAAGEWRLARQGVAAAWCGVGKAQDVFDRLLAGE